MTIASLKYNLEDLIIQKTKRMQLAMRSKKLNKKCMQPRKTGTNKASGDDAVTNGHVMQ